MSNLYTYDVVKLYKSFVLFYSYKQGRLLYCHPPPNTIDPLDFQSLGRNDSLPCGVGYFPDQSKAERFLKRLDEKQKRASSQCIDEVITEFDRLAFKQVCLDMYANCVTSTESFICSSVNVLVCLIPLRS